MSENDKNESLEEIMKKTPKYPERALESSAMDPRAEGVYAGPSPIPQPMGAVYAGPVAMMTYAGPQMMNNGMGFMSIDQLMQISSNQQPSAQNDPQPDYSDSKVCEMCGSVNSKGSKFCSECGHELKQGTNNDI